MNTSYSATRAQHHGIYHHLFELLIKVACIFATSSLVVQAFATYLEHLNTLWQFHVSYSALILIEASLVVSWFAIETQHEVPKALKLVSAVFLLSILATIFVVSEMYISGVNQTLKALLLSAIFVRCLLSSPISVPSRTTKRKRKAIREAIIFELKKNSEHNQRIRSVNDMIDRALLKNKQKQALKEVKLMKEQLLLRAYTKHNLAMAQINAQVADRSENKAIHREDYVIR